MAPKTLGISPISRAADEQHSEDGRVGARSDVESSPSPWVEQGRQPACDTDSRERESDYVSTHAILSLTLAPPPMLLMLSCGGRALETCCMYLPEIFAAAGVA